MDDQPDFRLFAREILDSDDRIDTVGEAPDAPAGLRLIAELMPDVVLVDFDMPMLNGLEAIETIRRRFPTVLTMLMSNDKSAELRGLALEAGAIGFIAKREFSSRAILQVLAEATARVIVTVGEARGTCPLGYTFRVGESFVFTNGAAVPPLCRRASKALAPFLAQVRAERYHGSTVPFCQTKQHIVVFNLRKG